MSMSNTEIWITIALIGIGTFLIRFSFVGLIGARPMPEWVLRHLRYTPVAVLPGLVGPLVLWPEATGGEPEPARISAAIVAFIVGYFSKNIIWSVCAGFVTLHAMLFMLYA